MHYGIILWIHIAESYDRMMLWSYITESYQGIKFRNYMIELYYRIILIKRIPVIPGECPEPPETSGDAPVTPMGHPMGAPGTLWAPPRTTGTAISQRMFSARSSRLLHPNPFVATRHAKNSPGPLYPVYVEDRVLQRVAIGPNWGSPKVSGRGGRPWEKGAFP